MLQSDVGTGKTAVYGMLAITVAMNYKQVVILMPNTGLATQVASELTNRLPEQNKDLIQLIISKRKAW